MYKTELRKKLNSNNTQAENPINAWDWLAKIVKETANTILRVKELSIRTLPLNEIEDLSVKEKKFGDDAESTEDKRKRIELKKERNKTLKEIKKPLKEEEDMIFNKELKER